jgi:hypothetical protein
VIIIRKKYGYVVALVLIAGLVMSIVRWNDYREKGLVDAIDADELTGIIYLERNPDADLLYNEVPIEDPESIEEFIEFLGQYKVQKVGTRNFYSEYPDEQFNFQLEYEDERIMIQSTIERDVLLNGDSQYTITNGPVDYGWIVRFFEEQD